MIGRVVASDGAERPEEVEGPAREEVPPDWRERDMIRRRMKRRAVMMEKNLLKLLAVCCVHRCAINFWIIVKKIFFCSTLFELFR